MGVYVARRLVRAVTTHDDQPRSARRCRPLAGLGLAVLIAAATALPACSSSQDEVAPSIDGGEGSTAPLPTLSGGVDLAAVEIGAVLVGDDLAFGTPLPSEQAAAEAFTDDPEVREAIARRVYSRSDGRLLAQALVLGLDGAELFDQGVLDGFVRGVVAAFGDGTPEEIEIGDRPVVASRGDEVALGFLEGDRLVVIRGVPEAQVRAVVAAQVAAIATGVGGDPAPVTPLVAIPIEEAFAAPVPTVKFEPIPPPEEESPSPQPPALPGATAVQGRYGVVAGERRTTVWAYTLDPATYPTAEVLSPALSMLASARSGGAPAATVEVIDRVVHRASGEGGPTVVAFRQGALVLVVEGADAGQVDAVVAAWIVELASS